MLSAEGSAEPGRWRTARAEYQRGIMDAFSNPHVEQITVMSSSGVGKTEILLNICGYIIDHDPSTMLIVQPTLEMGMAWSKDRFTPMIRDGISFEGKVTEARSKDGENTILHKMFVGGHITIAGANSAASLASRHIRIVMLDEVDRYPSSVGNVGRTSAAGGGEGDPVKLAIKRTITYANRKIIATSTPTVAGVSRIESLFNQSAKHFYFVPCTKCGYFQVLKWGQIKWEKEGKTFKGGTVHYECEKCLAKLSEGDKVAMVRGGVWNRVHAEGLPVESTVLGGIDESSSGNSLRVERHIGFHISELYSPWSSWQKIVEEFYESKGRRETLRVWKNTTLGEAFEEEESFVIDRGDLLARVEPYVACPETVLFLTAGVDVQEDRLEVVVKGWGLKDESWLIDRKRLYAPNGTILHNEVWERLLSFLSQEFKHEKGITLKVICVCVDSGYRTSKAYQIVREWRKKFPFIFAVKGLGGYGKPFIGKVNTNNKYKAKMLPLGVDEAKRIIYDRLLITEGEAQMHFNETCDEEYFTQLTSEKQVTKFTKGFPTKVWMMKDSEDRVEGRSKNEALDCEVYALAAKELLAPDFEKIAKNLDMKVQKSGKVQPIEEKVEGEEVEKPQPKRTIPKQRRSTGFSVGGWKI